jgi:DNA-binding SARP family transcriptional activator
MALRFGILGPLQVLQNGRSVDPGSRKQQIILASLLCNANSLVSVDSLVEALWDDEPPRTARKNIQVYVSALRGLAGAGSGPRISCRSGGYLFQAEPSELDSLSFEQTARGRHRSGQGDDPPALAEALALWRGRPLDGLRDVPLIDACAQRLERKFLAVFEDWAEAEIEAGGAASAIEHITEVAQEHPLRERLRTLQMTALGEIGRRSEALAVYDELRQSLAHELGLTPSPAVVRCYQSVLCEREPVPLGPGAPNLLPWDPPRFTGHAECTQELKDVLSGGRYQLVVITGPLGAGKTALAVHAAHQLGGSFPGGRVFIRLRGEDGTPRPLGELVSQLLRTVRPGTRPESAPDALMAWRRWLEEHRALVVLDSACREADVRSLLPDTGESAVIVTARTRLAGLESAYRLRVPPLAVAEGVQFLGRIIGSGRVAADPHSAERIVTATGALPLGLRLIGERLALLRHVPLREYAARVEAAPALLDELTAGDVAIRPQLAEAVSELSEPARQAIVRLGLLPEPVFTLSEAANVLEADEDAATQVLEALLEASIISVPEAEALAHMVLYEIPMLLHAYAREMADVYGSRAAANALSDPTLLPGRSAWHPGHH